MALREFKAPVSYEKQQREDSLRPKLRRRLALTTIQMHSKTS
jgi:hypothetical protein